MKQSQGSFRLAFREKRGGLYAVATIVVLLLLVAS